MRRTIRSARLPAKPSQQRPLVVVMARAAVMGRVKTRLAREIGQSEALRFYRTTRATVLRRINRDARFQVVIALDPPAAISDRSLPRFIPRIAQARGDLGHRMQTLLDAGGARPMIVIGTDIPGITAKAVAHACQILARHDCVMGPADDGGFWLFGTRGFRRPRYPFTDVRWSHAETADDVKRNLPTSTLGAGHLLSDVDSSRDLAQQRFHVGRVIAPRPCDDDNRK